MCPRYKAALLIFLFCWPFLWSSHPISLTAPHQTAPAFPLFCRVALAGPLVLTWGCVTSLANELGAKVTGVTSRLEHLITSVRQVGFPGIGTEMNICAGGLRGTVLTTTARRREARLTEGEVDDCSCSRGLSQPQESSEARAAFS